MYYLPLLVLKIGFKLFSGSKETSGSIVYWNSVNACLHVGLRAFLMLLWCTRSAMGSRACCGQRCVCATRGASQLKIIKLKIGTLSGRVCCSVILFCGWYFCADCEGTLAGREYIVKSRVTNLCNIFKYCEPSLMDLELVDTERFVAFHSM